MIVRGLLIGFLYMISKHHIYPGPEKKRPPKVNLFNFIYSEVHIKLIEEQGTDPSLYSGTKTNPRLRGKSGDGEGASHLQKEAR